jgi:hypothetical protein
LFFFEKKNQKTFVSWRSASGVAAPRKREKSLFASFSSEKEESFVLVFAQNCITSSRRTAA